MQKLTLKQKLCVGILLIYLVPILLLTTYSLIENYELAWSIFSLGVFVSTIGSAVLFFLLNKLLAEQTVVIKEVLKETFIQAHESDSASTAPMRDENEIKAFQDQIGSLDITVADLEKKQNQLIEEIDRKNAEMQKVLKEKAETRRQLDVSLEEYSQYKKSHDKLFEQKEVLLQEYQKTIENQRSSMDKNDQQIHLLENKVRDLKYEIKTLLHLADIHTNTAHAEAWSETSPEEHAIPEFDLQEPAELLEMIKTPGEAALLLKRCIDHAQKIASAYHFAKGAAKVREMPVDHIALELRRLYEDLKNETTGTVFVYSPQENKILFVNQPIKHLLGWGADKFTQDFHYLIIDGLYQWKNAISQMPPKAEYQLQIIMKNKINHDCKVNIHLGLIPFGIFKGHLIGVMF